MRIKSIILIIITSIQISIGQNPAEDSCFSVKYLDFFGLDKVETVKWPQSEIDGLLNMDFESQFKDSEIRTNFIVPMIVYQLKDYHPNCIKEIDTTYFNNITNLYLKIRKIESQNFAGNSIENKINAIRDDFYSQVEDVKYLPQMTMTFDDGPFYGVDDTSTTKLELVESQKTKFGILSVFKIDGKSVLKSQDKEGKMIWQKSITGLSNRSLTELHFAENAMEYNSVATIANMYSEGERFTLYLKEDGRFMYYFHSW